MENSNPNYTLLFLFPAQLKVQWNILDSDYGGRNLGNCKYPAKHNKWFEMDIVEDKLNMEVKSWRSQVFFAITHVQSYFRVSM